MVVVLICSNNTNKLSPQEQNLENLSNAMRSNNTNKLSPQELMNNGNMFQQCSNNTNKLSPQERHSKRYFQH